MYGPFGNLFPYSDQHAMNLDWIIQVAKDFLDQYTHIQEIISTGETSITDKTTAGLEALQAEKERLEGLLDAWYTTHSEDIAGQLTQAISDFQTAATAIGETVRASIPVDYTAMGNDVYILKNLLNNNSNKFLMPLTFSTEMARTAALNPSTGAHATTGCRTGYIEYTRPMNIEFNVSNQSFVVWIYSNNSTSAAQYTPVDRYTKGTLYIPYLTGTKHLIKIGFHKDDGTEYTAEEADAAFAAVKFTCQTDANFNTANAPADALAVGNSVNAINGTLTEHAYDLFNTGKNYIPAHEDIASTTVDSITYSCTNDVWSVSGSTGENIWFGLLAGSTSSFPLGLAPGDTVKLFASALSGTNVYMAFRAYISGEPLATSQYDNDASYTIPSNATGLMIRLEVPANRTLTGTVSYKPVVQKVLTNQQIIDQINTYLVDNAFNVIKPFSFDSATSSGITASASNGVVSISGTASASWYKIIYGTNTAMPENLAAGETYFAWLDGPSGLRLTIRAFPDDETIFETSSFGFFTIPADTTGIQIRLRVPNGQVIPAGTKVFPYVGKNIPSRVENRLQGFTSPKPMLTIIDDDGNNKFYTKLLPVITAKKVPIASAIVGDYINTPSTHSSMDWEKVIECYRGGAEILSHTMGHITGDVAAEMTELEIEMDYRKSKYLLNSHGIPNNVLIFAGNSGNNANCQAAAQKTFDYAIHSDGSSIINQQTFKPYYLPRYGIGIGSFEIPEGETVPTTPKQYIDSLVQAPGWMIWMLHTSSGDWTDDQVDGIEAAIDYALSQGVEIVTCEYALKQFVKI